MVKSIYHQERFLGDIVKEQGFQDVLFIADDMILLNNLIYHMLLDKEISMIFASTWDEGIKYIQKEKLKLIILDSILISKLNPSFVIPLIKKSKTPLFFINAKGDMWIYKVTEQIKGVPVIIHKQPLIVDRFLKTIQRILKR